MTEPELLPIVICYTKFRDWCVCEYFGYGYSYCIIESVTNIERSYEKKSFYQYAEKNSR